MRTLIRLFSNTLLTYRLLAITVCSFQDTEKQFWIDCLFAAFEILEWTFDSEVSRRDRSPLTQFTVS